MPDPTSTPNGPLVELMLQAGTLFAVPDAGHVRVYDNQSITWTAEFPFTVEFTPLTSASPPVADQPACALGGKYSFTLNLAALPPSATAPAYKYTIKGGGKAAGKVLDPIIIVDRR